MSMPFSRSPHFTLERIAFSRAFLKESSIEVGGGRAKGQSGAVFPSAL